uniref:Uncharacterized protein n=1 Tax=Trichogramma kaykai TaxID=54128 RepID=A0ABD2XP54_9HYME
MLKWTVSRSLSQASSTPHGPGGGGVTNNKVTHSRRPFRDLSNTPPAASGAAGAGGGGGGAPSSRLSGHHRVKATSAANGDNKPSLRSIKKTPSRRQRRCRSQGSDLRGYFHATKPNLRTGKRNSLTQRNSSSPVVIDGFYQSTPRVDADIGPLTVSYPQHQRSTTSSASSSSSSSSSCSSLAMSSRAMSSTLMTTTLPVDPQTLLIGSCFPSRHQQQQQQQPTMTLQSHVSDFFHQISMATSPEDVMEFEPLRLDRNGLAARTTRFAARDQQRRTPRLPKHARSARLSSRTDTPYHLVSARDRDDDSERRKRRMPLPPPLIPHRGNDETRMERDERLDEERIYEEIQETPSKGKSSGTKLERNNKPNNLYEDVDSLRNRIKNRRPQELPKDALATLDDDEKENQEVSETEHIYETIDERPVDVVFGARRSSVCLMRPKHNDSSVSSASQLLDDPSPTTWMVFSSPPSSPNDDDDDDDDVIGEFPLKRQRVIRRKRTLPQANSNNSMAKRPKMGEELPLIEAVNRHVKRLALETDLDLSTTMKQDEGQTTMQVDDEPQAQRKEEDAKETRPIESGRVDERRHGCVIDVDEPQQQQQQQQNEESPITSRKRCPINVVNGGSHAWQSPCSKSSSLALMMRAVDSFATPSSSDSERSSPCSAGRTAAAAAAAMIGSHQNQKCSTPEATPLVATVRRCLEYSPETPSEYGSGSSTLRNDEASYGGRGSIEVECSSADDRISVKIIRCRDLRRSCEPEGPIHAYVKAHIKDLASGEARCRVERTAVHRATPNPVFNEVLHLALPPNNNNNNNNNNSNSNNSSSNDRDTSGNNGNNSNNSNNSSSSSSSNGNGVKRLALDIAVWHRDRVARRSELLGCMTLPLPLSQDKEATWHPLEAGPGRAATAAATSSSSIVHSQDSVRAASLVLASSSPAKSSASSSAASTAITDQHHQNPTVMDLTLDNNNAVSSSSSSGTDDLTYLRHLELEPCDPHTGLPLHPGFAARGGRTPCTVTRRLVRHPAALNQVAWGFSLSWGRPPRVERVDPASPAERSGLRPGDYVVFVDASNVVTLARDDILELIQAAQSQLVLEVYRRGGVAALGGATSSSSTMTLSNNTFVPASVHPHHRQSIIAAPHQQHQQQQQQSSQPAVVVAFTAEQHRHDHVQQHQHHQQQQQQVSIVGDEANSEESDELALRESRYWACLRSGQARFSVPLAERRDVLAAADHMILFQNLDELLRISEEIRDEGARPASYLARVGRIVAAYRRYLGGLQRACCLLVALRKNSAFAKLVCEPSVPKKRRPDLTGVLLQPLEHYREMTRLLSQTGPRNSPAVRDLAQGYREATAAAGVMEPPRDTGKPLLSLQEVESRLVFARCNPFALAVPGRQWLYGGALSKVEGRRQQPLWALLFSDILVFATVSRDRVLFVTEEPLRLACIAEACFTVRKRPTEFRLQLTTQPSDPSAESTTASTTEMVQCGGTGGGGAGCSPHSRPRRRLLVLRAPSPESKAVWHNLLQRQINLVYYRIYVNTGYSIGGNMSDLDSPDDESPTEDEPYLLAKRKLQQQKQQQQQQQHQRELDNSPEIYKSTQQLAEDQLDNNGKQHHRSTCDDNLDFTYNREGCSTSATTTTAARHHQQHLQQQQQQQQRQDDNHLAQWVLDSHQMPPDHEMPIEEWTAEELRARMPREANRHDFTDLTEEGVIVNSDAEQQSTASSASLSTVKSNSLQQQQQSQPKMNGQAITPRDTSPNSISICRTCHRSGCPTPPLLLARDPFSPIPAPRLPPPDYNNCTRHLSTNNDANSRNFGAPRSSSSTTARNISSSTQTTSAATGGTSSSSPPPSRNNRADSSGFDATTSTTTTTTAAAAASGAGNANEDGNCSEDDLDCDGEPPYRALRRFDTMSSLDQEDELDAADSTQDCDATADDDRHRHRRHHHQQQQQQTEASASAPSTLRAWTLKASTYVVSKMSIFEQLSTSMQQQQQTPPQPPERTDSGGGGLDLHAVNNFCDEEVATTTSGATSGDDIWGTPTSGGPDDDHFHGSPPTHYSLSHGEDNWGLSDEDELVDEDEILGMDASDIDDSEVCNIPELSMEQLLVGGSFAGASTFRSFLGRHRLEPLLEEEDSLSVSSAGGGNAAGASSATERVNASSPSYKQKQQQQQPGWW